MRKCVTCKIEKPSTSEFFYKDKNRALGLMYRCKDCDKERKDSRVWKNRWAKFSKEEKREHYKRAKIYAQTEMGKAIATLAAYRKYDQKKGYENDLDKEYIYNIRVNFKCVYCDSKVSGLDRIDNKKGHTKENCVPCCKECNTARSNNFTFEEMKLIGEVIKNIKNKRLNAGYPTLE